MEAWELKQAVKELIAELAEDADTEYAPDWVCRWARSIFAEAVSLLDREGVEFIDYFCALEESVQKIANNLERLCNIMEGK